MKILRFIAFVRFAAQAAAVEAAIAVPDAAREQ